MLFSATIPPEIRDWPARFCAIRRSCRCAHASHVADGIEESVYFVDRSNKPALLAHLVKPADVAGHRIHPHQARRGPPGAPAARQRDSLGGDPRQQEPERPPAGPGEFPPGKMPVLVATDVASRGIDMDGITHVVNYDLPHEPETYIHRIGRTARAGASGAAFSLCCPEEMPTLRAVEKLIRRAIPVKKTNTVVQSPKILHPTPAGRPKFESQARPFRHQPHPMELSSRHPGQSRRRHSHRRRLTAVV